jgi:hypothetical protein
MESARNVTHKPKRAARFAHDTDLYGSRAFPAHITRENRKFPTIFENNVAVTKDADGGSGRGEQGDLCVEGVIFSDTIGENTADNGVNVVSPVGLKTATLNIEEQPTVGIPKAGQILDIRGTPFTADASLPAGSRVNDWSAVSIQAPSIRALNADVTFPSAATLRIEGPPTGGGVTAADAYSIRVMDGPVLIDQDADGALTLRGGIQCKNVSASGVLQLGQTNIKPAPGGDGYDLTLPAVAPKDGCVITSTAGGLLSFEESPADSAIKFAWNGQVAANNLAFWTDVAYSAGGKAHASPVKPSGDPVFSSILLASASPMEETDELTSMPLTSLRSISADRKTITFNVLTGAISLVGSCSLQHAPEGTRVNIFVVGAPSP